MSVRTIAENLARRFVIAHLPDKLRPVTTHLHSVAAHILDTIPAGPHRDEAIDHLERAGLALGKAFLEGPQKEKPDAPEEVS